MTPSTRGTGAAAFDAGDILYLDSTPRSGHSMNGPHYALVVSRKAFNHASGIVWACPIAQGEAAAQRASGFLITLSGAGTRTVGSIQVHLLRGLETSAHNARRIEKVPPHVLTEVLGVIASTIGLPEQRNAA